MSDSGYKNIDKMSVREVHAEKQRILNRQKELRRYKSED